MNGFFGGVRLTAGLFGACALIGCGSVNSPVVPDAAPGTDGAIPVDGSIIDGPIVIDGPPVVVDGPPIDGPPVVVPDPRFDVAFGKEFRVGYEFAGTGFIGTAAIVNTSAKPLNMSKLTIESVTDNDTTIRSIFAIDRASETPLDPGNAAGSLSGQAISLIIEGGIMTEPLIDESLMFSLTFEGCTDACVGKNVHVDARIRIDDAEIVLPMDVSIVASRITVILSAARSAAREVVQAR